MFNQHVVNDQYFWRFGPLMGHIMSFYQNENVTIFLTQ
jgi:hypothetical protein